MAIIKAWSLCIDCGHEGVLEYARIPGEDYSDSDALGVMLIYHCPLCEASGQTLVGMDFYREILCDPVNEGK